MNKNEIATLIHFNFWANNRILTSCERISLDKFIQLQVPDPGWGSLRGILVHTLDTEYGWRSILQRLNEDHILVAEDFENVPALKTRWEIEHEAWLKYVASLNDESINLGYGDDPIKGPKVWQTIIPVVTHSIQHRSEAAAILTGYGHSPGELDFDLFLSESPEFFF